MDPTYPLVPIANLTGLLLVLIPLSINSFRSWNTGVTMFASWIAVESLATGVNTIIWKDNANNIAPAWCDITSHLSIGSGVAIPACSFVITRRLYKITRHRDRSFSENKRAALYFDLFFCAGLPAIVMGIYYVVQESRFGIEEDLGCVDGENISGLSMILVDGWTALLPAISGLFYCPRIAWFFYHQRREMNEFLDSNQSVNRSSFFRMLVLGLLDALGTLPAGLVALITDAFPGPLSFYPGWKVLHDDWAPVTISKAEWSADVWDTLTVRWNEWINPLSAVVFFLLFGLTTENRSRYLAFFWAAVKPLGLKPSPPTDPEKSDINFQTAGSGATETDTSMNKREESGDSFMDIRLHDSVSNLEEGVKDLRLELGDITPILDDEEIKSMILLSRIETKERSVDINMGMAVL